MRKDLKVIFKDDIQRIKKLKGGAKVAALKDLNEKVDAYMVAEDFADYYPQIYTEDTLKKIAKARSGVEADNILIGLRRAM